MSQAPRATRASDEVHASAPNREGDKLADKSRMARKPNVHAGVDRHRLRHILLPRRLGGTRPKATAVPRGAQRRPTGLVKAGAPPDADAERPPEPALPGASRRSLDQAVNHRQPVGRPFRGPGIVIGNNC